MHVRDRVDLDRRSGSELADGLRAARGFRVGRLAVLPEREPVATRDARLQGAAGRRPIPDPAVHHDLGVFRYWVRLVGLLGPGKRAVPAGPKPDEEQETGKQRPLLRFTDFPVPVTITSVRYDEPLVSSGQTRTSSFGHDEGYRNF